MPSAPHDDWRDRPEPLQLSRLERWTINENDEPGVVFNSDAPAGWSEKWSPPCPNGNPHRPRRALGFRERNIGELELRVALGGDDLGACQVIVDERDEEVYVRVLVCYEEDDQAGRTSVGYLDCPVRVWLERPLGQRAVIDVDSDDELPLFTPQYRNNVPQPDHGYRPAHRRTRTR